MAGFYLAFTNMPLAAVKIKFSIFSELLIMLLHGRITGLYRVKMLRGSEWGATGIISFYFYCLTFD